MDLAFRKGNPMTRLTKITTRRGDDGRTDLASGGRIRKDSRRIEAIGSLDELNSAIGVARSLHPQAQIDALLREIQNDLLRLGASLAHHPTSRRKQAAPAFDENRILALEREIAAMQDQLGPLENFILPGGTPAAASLQWARAVCRRAERDVVALSADGKTAPEIRIYLNRLSDFLFQAARRENQTAGFPETFWNSR
jgi:cob(I)alamin adenosyltransferase